MPKSQMPALELPTEVSQLFNEAARACQVSVNRHPEVTKAHADASVSAVLRLTKYKDLKSVRRELRAYVEYLVGLR